MTQGTRVLLLATVAAAAFSAAPAAAADLPVDKAPLPAVDVWNPWLIRLRAVGVVPRDHGDVRIPGVPIADPVPGNVIAVSTTVIPEIDISYFFTPNIALELILGSTPHKVTGQNALNGLQIGQTWLLPPTLTLQYHFTNFGAFKPYIGAGPNYTVFYNTSGANIPAVTPLVGAPITVTNLGIKNTFGVAAQVGFDYFVTKNVGLNFDVKKLWLRPDWHGAVSIAGGAPLPSYGKVELDPWLVGGGVFYKF